MIETKLAVSLFVLLGRIPYAEQIPQGEVREARKSLTNEHFAVRDSEREAEVTT
jgi:hypothetical protein